MSNNILFTETQKFTQWWIWLVLLGLNGLFLYGVFVQVIGGEQFGDKPMSDLGLLIAFGLSILFTVIFYTLRLETVVKSDGIYVRFFPFHLKFKFISWEQLDKIYVREYSPITEFGGWGIKFSLTGKGTVYNVSGSTGLQLEFKTGKKLLIGTQKRNLLISILDKIEQKIN